MALPSQQIGPQPLQPFVGGIDIEHIVMNGVLLHFHPEIEASVPKEALDTTHKQHVVREYIDRYATLTIRKGNKILCATDRFLLVGLNEADQERFSMVYTHGDPVIRAGMGRRPRMYSYTGMLVDTEKDGSGISEWKVLYDRYFRGHACVKQYAVAELRFRDQLRRGYITSCNMPYDAANPQACGLSFTMFVIESRSVDGSTGTKK